MSSMTGAGGFGGRTGMQKSVGGYNVKRLQQFTPEQMQLFQQLMGGVGPGLQGGLSQLSNLAAGDQSQFEQLEAPALRQFGELQGNLASRFSGMGSGARRSSGFQNTMNSAASDLAERLQSQRLQLQQNAIQQLLGLSNQLLGQRPYEQFLQEKKPKGWQQLLGAGLPILGGAAGAVFGGPMGAALGANLGSSLGSAFTGGGGGQANFSGIGDLPTKWR